MLKKINIANGFEDDNPWLKLRFKPVVNPDAQPAKGEADPNKPIFNYMDPAVGGDTTQTGEFEITSSNWPMVEGDLGNGPVDLPFGSVGLMESVYTTLPDEAGQTMIQGATMSNFYSISEQWVFPPLVFDNKYLCNTPSYYEFGTTYLGIPGELTEEWHEIVYRLKPRTTKYTLEAIFDCTVIQQTMNNGSFSYHSSNFKYISGSKEITNVSITSYDGENEDSVDIDIPRYDPYDNKADERIRIKNAAGKILVDYPRSSPGGSFDTANDVPVFTRGDVGKTIRLLVEFDMAVDITPFVPDFDFSKPDYSLLGGITASNI